MTDRIRYRKYLYRWACAPSLVLLALLLSHAAQAKDFTRLPALSLAVDSVTVSGLSSGAYMAGQFEVAYASSLAGAALIAGGPYGCSHGSVPGAMLNCSCPAEQPFALYLAHFFGAGCQILTEGHDARAAETATKNNEKEGFIDSSSALKNHRVWLFSGGKDRVVDQRLVVELENYYQHFGVPNSQLHHEKKADAGHGFPSLKATGTCSDTKTPYLTACQIDGAGELLKWLYPSLSALKPKAAKEATALKRFDQVRYGDSGVFNGLADSGLIYVPKACERAGASCKLHVVFHGCEQGESFDDRGQVNQEFGQQFVKGAGYNRWAEAGHIVVLYPQVKASTTNNPLNPYQYNPKGCWDFWGYTDRLGAAVESTTPRFARKDAPQLKAVRAMIDDLLRSP